jgi:hypothetical protein
MTKRFRIALGSAALVAGLALAGAAPASAQVGFEGSFPLPHGRLSIGFGSPSFPVGGYVPYGYSVIQDPDYGYGFYYGDSFIPCEPYGSRWIVVERPVYFGRGYVRPFRSYGYVRPYRYDGFRRDFRAPERFERRDFGRRTFERRDWGRGHEGRDRGRDRGGDRGWRR